MAEMQVGSRLIFVGGQIGWNGQCEFETDDFALQVAQALRNIVAVLEQGGAARSVSLSDEEAAMIKPLGLLTAKPIIYATNVSEDDLAGGNAFTEEVKTLAAQEGAETVRISAQVEAELIELPEEDRAEFLAGLGVIMALGPTVSQHYGARRMLQIGQDTRQAVWLALFMSVLVIFVLRHLGPFLHRLGIEAEVVDLAQGYLNGVSWGVPGCESGCWVRRGTPMASGRSCAWCQPKRGDRCARFTREAATGPWMPPPRCSTSPSLRLTWRSAGPGAG